MVFVVVMVFVLGNMVGEVFLGFVMLIVFVVSGILGVLVYVFVWLFLVILVGVYSGVYGFIGVFSFFLWVCLCSIGDN